MLYPPLGQVTTVLENPVTFYGSGSFYIDGETVEFTDGKATIDVKSRSEFSVPDGRSGVVINAGLSSSEVEFDQLFEGVDSKIHVKRQGERLWKLTGYAAGLDQTHYTLGTPRNLEQGLSFFRKDPNWMIPEGGINFPNNHGTAVQFQQQNGLHVVVLPLAGVSNCTNYLYGSGEIKTFVENDGDDQQDGFQLLVSADYDLDTAWSRVFAPKVDNPAGLSWIDGLMYCTWNGLGPNLTKERVINALQDLHDSGVRVCGLIIDDGWQQTRNNRRLVDFEAHSGFPGGLRELIDEIKGKFPYITDVGVWSTVLGYWNGFDFDSVLAERYKTVKCHIGSEQVVIPDGQDINRFFDEYFTFLANSGVTLIKLDNQASIDGIVEHDIRGRIWQKYQDSLWRHAKDKFRGKIIYCMAMVPNIMQYSLQGKQVLPVFRNSDDFFPTIPSSHYWHVYTNIYTSLYTKHLSCKLDFDMFQTQMDSNFASLHAAARCISGGPIYITDTPKQHDIELIKSLSAVDGHGRDVILRLDSAPTVLNPYLWKDGVARTCNSHNGNTLYGYFNTTEDSHTEVIATGGRIFRSYKTGEVFFEQHQQTFEPGEWDIYTSISLYQLPSPHMTGSYPKVGFFGKIDHIVGVAALESVSVTDQDDHVEASCKIKNRVLGKYGFWVQEGQVFKVFADDREFDFKIDGNLVTVEVTSSVDTITILAR